MIEPDLSCTTFGWDPHSASLFAGRLSKVDCEKLIDASCKGKQPACSYVISIGLPNEMSGTQVHPFSLHILSASASIRLALLKSACSPQGQHHLALDLVLSLTSMACIE
jgi:hypothetical protein